MPRPYPDNIYEWKYGVIEELNQRTNAGAFARNFQDPKSLSLGKKKNSNSNISLPSKNWLLIKKTFRVFDFFLLLDSFSLP